MFRQFFENPFILYRRKELGPAELPKFQKFASQSLSAEIKMSWKQIITQVIGV
jgi:hypothetical protein